MPPVENETSFSEGEQTGYGKVSVEFETREGSGKFDKDFKYTQGTVVSVGWTTESQATCPKLHIKHGFFCTYLQIFSEEEYRKTIVVPIINDNQYEADTDFYVLLKNPKGGSGTGDPSITRVTIIDDDGM